jgi:hypothetical protein
MSTCAKISENFALNFRSRQCYVMKILIFGRPEMELTIMSVMGCRNFNLQPPSNRDQLPVLQIQFKGEVQIQMTVKSVLLANSKNANDGIPVDKVVSLHCFHLSSKLCFNRLVNEQY